MSEYRYYENQQRKYLESLESNPNILNKEIRDNTLNAVINCIAIYLYIKCPHCSVNLVDPNGGIKFSDNRRRCKCGNCGYEGYY